MKTVIINLAALARRLDRWSRGTVYMRQQTTRARRPAAPRPPPAEQPANHLPVLLTQVCMLDIMVLCCICLRLTAQIATYNVRWSNYSSWVERTHGPVHHGKTLSPLNSFSLHFTASATIPDYISLPEQCPLYCNGALIGYWQSCS